MSAAVFPIGFNLTSVVVKEGESVTMEIILEGNITRPLLVTVETEDLTTSPDDYSPLRETLTFQPLGGNTTVAFKTVTVNTTSDDFAELTEEFRIVLSQPSLGLNITQGSVTVGIVDSTGEMMIFTLLLASMVHAIMLPLTDKRGRKGQCTCTCISVHVCLGTKHMYMYVYIVLVLGVM